MAQHGYLHDTYDSGDFGREDDRERGWRDRHGDWRDHERTSGRWDEGGSDRKSMFGWDEHDRRSGYEDRDRGGDWHGTDRDYPGHRERSAFTTGSGYPQGQRRSSAHPDDHYRSWRDKQIQALDRDYEDYCREREHQFHQDFDAWRSQRRANYQPLRTGMTQSGLSHDPSGEVQVSTEATPDQSGTDPMGEATLGTNSGSSTGRGRR